MEKKKKKIPPIELNIGDELVLLIREGKSIGLKWVKQLIDLLITSDMSSNLLQNSLKCTTCSIIKELSFHKYSTFFGRHLDNMQIPSLGCYISQHANNTFFQIHCSKLFLLKLFCLINSFMPNAFSLPYQLDKSISNFRVVERYFSFLLKFKRKFLFANSGESDQMLRFAASDLVLHCLPMSHKKDARLMS